MRLFIWLLLLLGFARSGVAQETTPGQAPKKERPYAVAPLVTVSPAFGNGVGAMGLYFYRFSEEDEISPPSSIAAMGAYSDRDSYVAALFSMNYLDEDRWRLLFGGPFGRFRNEYNIPDLGEVRFDTRLAGGFLRGLRRTWADLFLGLQGGVFDLSYEEGNEASRTYFEAYEVQDNTSGMLGLVAQYDTRDHERYPESGILADLALDFFPESLGSIEEYYSTQAEINSYHKARERQVLALRASMRLTPSGTPYSGLSTLGRRSDLRGYMSGEIVAENLLSAQAEYRWFLTRKLGVVGFGGIAGLYDDSIDNLDGDTTYYSGGVGLRYVLHEANRVNFRIDYAWGEDDEQGLYVGMREAF